MGRLLELGSYHVGSGYFHGLVSNVRSIVWWTQCQKRPSLEGLYHHVPPISRKIGMVHYWVYHITSGNYFAIFCPEVDSHNLSPEHSRIGSTVCFFYHSQTSRAVAELKRSHEISPLMPSAQPDRPGRLKRSSLTSSIATSFPDMPCKRAKPLFPGPAKWSIVVTFNLWVILAKCVWEKVIYGTIGVCWSRYSNCDHLWLMQLYAFMVQCSTQDLRYSLHVHQSTPLSSSIMWVKQCHLHHPPVSHFL